MKRYQLGNPFAGYDDGEASDREVAAAEVTLRWQITFSLSGKKIGYASRGEQWDYESESPRWQVSRTVFDGTEERGTLKTVGRTFGHIVTVGTPGPLLTAHVNTTSFWLAFDPLARLQATFFSVDEMKVTNPRAYCDGRHCIELTIPRGTDWLQLLYVDPGREYVPVEMVRKQSDLVHDTLAIEYVPDDQAGWRVSSWTSKWFNSRGGLKRTWLCEVKGCNINDPLPSEVFTLQFPVGTPVVEDSRHTVNTTNRSKLVKRFFIVGEGGKKRYLSPNEFDRYRTRGTNKTHDRLSERVSSLAQATEEQRDELVSELKLRIQSTLPFDEDLASLLKTAARKLFNSERPESALEFCREFKGLSDRYDRLLDWMIAALGGELRRKHLVGNPIEVTGTTVAGEHFDWAAYSGRVVLVDFWFTSCEACLEEMPHIKALYDSYHERGFDVVGVSVDREAAVVREYLHQEDIPWTTIHEPWRSLNSNTLRYNVKLFPTSILVDREGKVVSLEARGDELDRLLVELIGPSRAQP